MTASNPYAFVPYVLIIPPGSQFSSIHKLLRPFHSSSWTAIFGLFALSIITITMIRLAGKETRDLFLGSRNQSPYLNILIVFLGGTMHSLPKKQFARNLLMIFILYSLIVRNIYQGVLVTNMQSNDIHKPVASIAEMIQRDFYFYVTLTFVEHVKNLSIYDR